MRKLSLPEGKHLSPLLLVKFWRMELQLVSYRLGIYIFIYIYTYYSNLTNFCTHSFKIIHMTLGLRFFSFLTRLRRQFYLYCLCILIFRTERKIWIGYEDGKKIYFSYIGFCTWLNKLRLFANLLE